MIAIDTNVVVRLLVGDHLAQTRQARRLLERHEVAVVTTVLLESEWVLRAGYGFSRGQIAAALRAFLGLPNVNSDAPAVIAHALNAFDDGLDFADALHLALASKATDFFTFDRQLAKAAKGGPKVALVPA